MEHPDHDFHTIVCGQCAYSFPVPIYCGNRFCPICSTRRRRTCREKLNHVVENTQTTFDTRFRFVTLTIPNVDDPAAGVRTLIESFRRLRQRNFWRTRVDGGVFVIEMTGRPSRWHVHIHAFIMSRWLPIKELSRQWQKVSPGKIVDIKLIPFKAAKLYLTKYITKSTLPEPFQQIASDALKGVRMFQFFGSWHNLANELKPVSYECPKCNSRAWLFQQGDEWYHLKFDNLDAEDSWDMQNMSDYTFEGAKQVIELGKKTTQANYKERERQASESDYLYNWKKQHDMV